MKKICILACLAFGLASVSQASLVTGLDGVADSSTMADVAGSGWTTESGSTVRTYVNGGGVSGLIGSAREAVYVGQFISTDSLLADTTYTLAVRAGNWGTTTGTELRIDIGYDDSGWVSLANKTFTVSEAGEITPTINGRNESLVFTTGATVSGNVAIRLARTGTVGRWGGFDVATLNAVPEPATLGMVAVFGGGLLFIRRKLMM